MLIVLIDDDVKITAMLKRALVYEGYAVQIANHGTEGITLVQGQKPDLVILDIMMPMVDGWEVCRQIRGAGQDTPILMLTARDDVSDRVKGLNLGADDYLVKPFALEELLARVKALLRRAKPQEAKEGILSYGDLVLDTASREARRQGESIALTAKEYELLKLLMENPRRVLTRDVLMEKVWGLDFDGESNVLERYIGMLRQKINAGDKDKCIKTVRGVGYVLK